MSKWINIETNETYDNFENAMDAVREIVSFEDMAEEALHDISIVTNMISELSRTESTLFWDLYERALDTLFHRTMTEGYDDDDDDDDI